MYMRYIDSIYSLKCTGKKKRRRRRRRWGPTLVKLLQQLPKDSIIRQACTSFHVLLKDNMCIPWTHNLCISIQLVLKQGELHGKIRLVCS